MLYNCDSLNRYCDAEVKTLMPTRKAIMYSIIYLGFKIYKINYLSDDLKNINSCYSLLEILQIINLSFDI
jgi:hypothetical protein